MNYLSFDFGDGTTSAAVCNGAGEPVVQNILAGEDEIPSLLNYCKGGDGRNRAVIGANAVSVGDTEAGLRMNWKSRPTQMEKTPDYPDRARIADTKIFMKEVYRAYVQQNGSPEDTRIVIGTPSAWTAEDRKIYRTYAENQITGMRDVLVLSESQAAYLFAQRFLRDGRGKPLSSKVIQNGLLIVDVGSSTTDFTFARGMNSRHYGIALGAKYVDENLYKWGLSQSDADDRLLALLDDPRNREVRLRLVFKCRERKEEYFRLCSPGEHTQRVPERVEELLGDDEISFRLGDLEKGRTMSEELFDSLLDRGCADCYRIPVRDSLTGRTRTLSWREHFRAALHYVAEEIIGEGLDRVSVVLTGGASRMYFIDEDVRDVLGNDVSIFAGRDKDRSFSVVKGLAWAGYAVAKIDEKTERLEAEVLKLRPTISDAVRSRFVSDIAADVVRSVRAELAMSMRTHMPTVRSRAKIRSYMQSVARSRAKGACEGKRGEFPELFRKMLDTDRVRNLLQDLVEEFGRVDIAFEQPPFQIPTLAFPPVNVAAIDLLTFWDDIRSIWTSESELDNEYLNDGKLDSILGYLDLSYQDEKWDELRSSIERSLSGGSGSFVAVVTDLFLRELLNAKRREIEALKGVFS